MSLLALHHVSIITADLSKSLPFYRDVFGLTEIPRPNFPVAGAWLACGDLQVHLVVHPEGTFRKSPAIDRNDWHFAFRTDDFEGVMQRLKTLGFTEELPQGDPKCLLVSRSGLAGFPQLYLRDPDLNVVEINGAR
ncbi:MULTISPECIES: VOC family protein [unclassified Sinorhizobium]|uniref:VOC family protein n=1 Tax=unclassified Sinorhizobium TaxID=2613772 RepID=UPI0024C464C3|nr:MULTISPECIES: VOC family protein [unclassified Sinorhizobium]MDK1373405.1 VOC family protein [Sinorhizobium sp. 6-70]MDK1482838.1 VOC family protein [Sinorhizobium sp. 6-117]